MRIAPKEVPVLSSHHADIPKNRWSWRLLYNFLLYVSPVALLTVAFPFVTPILSKNYVGSVPLIQIILAASIVVPWLSQAVCMPIYRALESEHLKVEDARREVQEEAAILKRDHKSKEAQELLATLDTDPKYQHISELRAFSRHWGYLYLVGLPIAFLFAIPVVLVLHWDMVALVSFLFLSMLNVAYAQLLIVPNVAKNRPLWFFAWVGYTIVLLTLPTVWFLPPLVGSAILFSGIGREIKQLFHFSRLPLGAAYRDVIRGLLTGSILWADKYVLFLVTNGKIDVIAIYMSLVPCVIAYNYFFVVESNRVNGSIQRLWTLFNKLPFNEIEPEAHAVVRISHASVRNTLIVSVICSVITGILMYIFVPNTFPLAYAGLTVAWLFLAMALFIYQLEYMTMFKTVHIICAVHLLIVTVAFSIIPNDGGYLPIIIGEAILALVTWILYRRAWANPEYSLFWRRALAW